MGGGCENRMGRSEGGGEGGARQVHQASRRDFTSRLTSRLHKVLVLPAESTFDPFVFYEENQWETFVNSRRINVGVEVTVVYCCLLLEY